MADVKRTVFISYAHASPAHEKWVKDLSQALETRSIRTILDQKDLHLGEVIEQFQKEGIRSADRVLVICSEAYVDKTEHHPASGAFQEKFLAMLEYEGNPRSIKFIPILRDNTTQRLPKCLQGRLWIDFSDDAEFQKMVNVLQDEILVRSRSEE